MTEHFLERLQTTNQFCMVLYVVCDVDVVIFVVGKQQTNSEEHRHLAQLVMLFGRVEMIFVKSLYVS